MLRAIALLHSAAIVKALLIYVGYRFGTYLDRLWDTGPWMMVVFVFLGGFVGLFWIIFAVVQSQK